MYSDKVIVSDFYGLQKVLTMYRLPFAAGVQLALFGDHPPRSGLFPQNPETPAFQPGFRFALGGIG